MQGENTRDNSAATQRTDLRTTDQHCSWRDVYARLAVDPSFGDKPDSAPSSRSAEPRDGNEHDDAASDDSTVTL